MLALDGQWWIFGDKSNGNIDTMDFLQDSLVYTYNIYIFILENLVINAIARIGRKHFSSRGGKHFYQPATLKPSSFY